MSLPLRDEVLALVVGSGPRGITAAEIENFLSKETYHGPVSGALSRLNTDGKIRMLGERRDVFLNGKVRKFRVYVLPKHAHAAGRFVVR